MLLLFNTYAQRETLEGELISTIIPGQELWADEVFTGSFAVGKHGRNAEGAARDAALEEITHLIHNQGISFVYPDKQARLDAVTQNAIGTTSSWVDLRTEGEGNVPDGIDDAVINGGNDLPRPDVDDELLSGAVESYLNHTAGESAFYLDGRTLDNTAGEGIFHATANGVVSNDIVSSDALTSANNDENSHIHLRNHHAATYELVEEIFGPRDDLLTRLQQAPNP